MVSYICTSQEKTELSINDKSDSLSVQIDKFERIYTVV